MGQLQRGHAIAAMVLGGIELLCGILVIILSIVISKKAEIPAAFSPWWAGAVFAIPGILGVIVGMTKNYGCMIAFMVLNIIAFVIQCVGIIILFLIAVVYLAVASTIDKNCAYNPIANACTCITDSGESFTVYGLTSCDAISSVASMSVAIIAFLAIALVVSFAASIVACCGTCCNRGQPQGGVVFQSK